MSEPVVMADALAQDIADILYNEVVDPVDELRCLVDLMKDAEKGGEAAAPNVKAHIKFARVNLQVFVNALKELEG